MTSIIPQDKPQNNFSYYLLGLFLISLPFDRFYSQIVLVCLLAHSLFFASLQKRNKQSLKQLLFLTGIYLLTIICTIYTPDKTTAFTEWEKQLGILLIPIIFYLNPINISVYKKPLLILFSASCVFAIIILYVHAFSVIQYNKLPLTAIFSKAFINHNFSNPIDIHATYLSCYLMLSLTFCLDEAIITESKKNKALSIIPISILSLGLLQLSSKSVLISGLVIILFVFPLTRLSGKNRFYFLFTALTIAVFATFLIVKIDSFNTRLLIDLKNDLVQSSETNELLEPRIVRWKHVIELIKSQPILGYGTGSERILLNESYYKHGLYNSFLNNLNAHNQYLSLWLKTGISGLLLYLFILFRGFRLALTQRDVVFLAFMFLITVVSFSENILDVNKGIFFYSFFLSFFIFSFQMPETQKL